ncbi:TetR/AcrR family transcriptional regulator [Cohnella faecalis]|uniref:TetR/AcrR family transcriptional regulator n=1 Tax=Cohnella faecalis TaxID=2315694 RepID=A0A398CPX0_9BACL|nr:TetR/AcrR family transcriptional regulator [Cohnella faecalis]RIE01501.1 TetR/AcrR family transcriptional regulator [Cohnella faecalis]
MAEQIDRRQVRTKQLLRHALMELIEEHGTESLTVTNISNRAGVNRGTFYLHYRDAGDMLEQIKEEVFGDLIRLLKQIDVFELMEYASKDAVYPRAQRAMEEIYRNRDFFKVIFGPKGDPSFPLRIKSVMKEHFSKMFDTRQPAKEKMLVPLDYLVAYTTSANLGVIQYWIENGAQQSPEEVALILTRLVNHGPLTSTGLRTK